MAESPDRPGSPRLAPAAFPALALLFVLAGCGNDDGTDFVVSDSAGIRISASLGPDRPLGAAPVRLAALQPPDSALMAMPWGVAADPMARRIYVADARNQRVAVFDGEGGYVRTFGRAGDGPGEFRSASAIAIDEQGALAVWDARRGIISRWSAGGELLDEQRAPVSYWGPGFAVRRDRVLAVTSSTVGSERRQSLVEAAGDGDPVELFALSRELVPLDLPGMNMPAPRIFAPSVVWTTAGDTVLVLNGPGYRIDAHTGGSPVASFRRDIEPIPVTGAMATARVEAGPYRGFMRRAGLSADQIVAAVGHEEVTSPVEWLSADPSGRLWVSRGSGEITPDRVDILADGRYRGTFPLAGLPVAFLSDSTFIALEVTDLGETLLGLYELRPIAP